MFRVSALKLLVISILSNPKDQMIKCSFQFCEASSFSYNNTTRFSFAAPQWLYVRTHISANVDIFQNFSRQRPSNIFMSPWKSGTRTISCCVFSYVIGKLWNSGHFSGLHIWNVNVSELETFTYEVKSQIWCISVDWPNQQFRNFSSPEQDATFKC